MKRKIPESQCDRIFDCLSPDQKRSLLSTLSNYDSLCFRTEKKDPLLFRDVVGLVSNYLEYNDYNNLKSCCKTFYNRLGYYPLFKRLRDFYDVCLEQKTPIQLLTDCFLNGIVDYVKRMKAETGITLKMETRLKRLILYPYEQRTKKYYKLGPAFVHYPTGLLLKSDGKTAMRKNPRGHIYQTVASDTFYKPNFTSIAYIDKHMSKEQKERIKDYDAYLKKF